MFSKFEGNINLSNERIQINTNERAFVIQPEFAYTVGGSGSDGGGSGATTRRRLLN